MEQAHGVRSREAPVTLSAAEEAYLRRFVRRHALTGAAGRGLVACVLVALGVALWPARDQQSAIPQPSSAPDAGALAAEIEAIRSEVAALPDRDATDAATQAAVAELARRIEAIVREIGALRSRTEVVPAAPPARAPAPGDTGVAALAERLTHVEWRQRETESERGRVEGRLLARLQDFETRQQGRAHEEAAALRLLHDRVEQLERSRDVAEARQLSGQQAILARLGALEARSETLPASPQP